MTDMSEGDTWECVVCGLEHPHQWGALRCEAHHTWGKWKDWLRGLVGLEPKHYVSLHCPETGEQVATEHTTPYDTVEFPEDGHTSAAYPCTHCGGTHVFLWGPPAPVYVGEAEQVGYIEGPGSEQAE